MYFNVSYANYLTNLDTLFDTRLGLLSILMPKYCEELLGSDGYTDRVKDDFSVGGVRFGYESFLPIYRNRNKNILKYSGLTFIPYIIACEINRHQQNNFNGECFRKWHLHINTYPYVLNDEEKENIKEIFHQYMDEKPEIKYHYINPMELGSEFMDAYNIEVVVDYDGLNWLSYFMYNTNNKFINRKFELCVPKIMNSSGISEQELNDEFFKKIENSFSTHLTLSFLDSYCFSDRIIQMRKKIDTVVEE